MPEVELLRFSSKEGDPQFQGDNISKALVPTFPNILVVSENTLNSQQNSGNGGENALQLDYPSRRRRSCALVNTPSPCVNKAIQHIQELEKKIEDWFQQLENAPFRTPTEKNHTDKVVRFPSMSSNIAKPPVTSLMSNCLCIEGMGLYTTEKGTSTPLREETGAVLSEVIDLIGRLEADRQEAEEALKLEKKRRKTLGEKIDRLSLWRLQQFPVAVQKEHEACMRDISELQWHLKFKKERLTQVKNRLMQTEVLNQRLKEDIDFVKKHGPLVKEKLELESSVMNQINNAQMEASDTFSKISVDLKKAEQQFEGEQIKATKERCEMANELEGIADHLKELLQDFQQSKAQWNAYCSKVTDTEEKLALINKLCRALLEQIPHLQKQETTMNDEVIELKLKIEAQIKKFQQLTEDTSELQRQIEMTKSGGEIETSQLQQECNNKRQALLALHDKNKECELEIEDLIIKIQESEHSAVQLEKDRQKMLQKISQNEEHRHRATEELSQVAAVHSATKEKLEDLEQQTFMEEQRMREISENMKKQIMSEMKALAIIKGKIASNKTELLQSQTNTDQEKKSKLKELEDAASVTLKLENEMEEFRKRYHETKENIENLMLNLQEVEMMHKVTAERLGQEKATLLTHLSIVEERHAAVSKELNHVLSRTEDLRKKSADYKISADLMEKAGKAIPDAIDKLQLDFDDMEFKHKSATYIINNLQDEISNCKDRIKLSEETNTSLYKNRQKTMEETKAALDKGLQENAELAQEYRVLQKALLVAKGQAVSVYEEKNRMEASFQDHKQLSLLQTRMHKALVEYFKQRGLYSQAGLAKFQALCHENSKKIGTVQEELSKAIQRISAFLHSLTDDSTTTDDAATNKQRSLEAVLKHKKKPTVQIAV
ncbi:coiled-coil domain-containing protein 178 [Amia ocellicauda]|uniref:coiled-coil domain-containing protein 178 n=1 Tax=Amia ocellicauda TaxID=2972642 RepID=UPI0034644667